MGGKNYDFAMLSNSTKNCSKFGWFVFYSIYYILYSVFLRKRLETIPTPFFIFYRNITFQNTSFYILLGLCELKTVSYIHFPLLIIVSITNIKVSQWCTFLCSPMKWSQYLKHAITMAIQLNRQNFLYSFLQSIKVNLNMNENI